MYGTPGRREQERLARVRAMAQSRTSQFGKPMGPDPGTGLDNRRGVADSVPQNQLTPEQFRERNMPTQNQEMPHGPNAGRVWDQGGNRGAGGYFDRAPNPTELRKAGPTPVPEVPMEIPRTGPRIIDVGPSPEPGPEAPKPKTLSDYGPLPPSSVVSSMKLPTTDEPSAPPPPSGKVDLGPTETNYAGLLDRLQQINQSTGLESAEFLAGGKPADLHAQARAFGLDPDAYGPDAQGQLEADVAAKEARHAEKSKNFDTIPVIGGGYRYTPNQAMRDSVAKRQERGILDSLWGRYGEKATEMGITRDQFTKQYHGDGSGGLTPAQKAANLQGFISDQGIRGAIEGDRRKSLKQRTDQDLTARRWGTSVANIAFMQSLQQARTPEERYAVLMGAQAMNPNLGFGNAAAMLQRGQDDLAAQMGMMQQSKDRDSMQAQIAQKQFEMTNPEARALAEHSRIHGLQDHGQFVAQLRQHYARQNQGTPFNQQAEATYLRDESGRRARDIGSRIQVTPDGSIGGLTPGEMSFLQNHAANHRASLGKDASKEMAFRNWAGSLGLHDNHRKVQELWARLVGQDPQTFSQWTNWSPMLPDTAPIRQGE